MAVFFDMPRINRPSAWALTRALRVIVVLSYSEIGGCEGRVLGDGEELLRDIEGEGRSGALYVVIVLSGVISSPL